MNDKARLYTFETVCVIEKVQRFRSGTKSVAIELRMNIKHNVDFERKLMKTKCPKLLFK